MRLTSVEARELLSFAALKLCDLPLTLVVVGPIARGRHRPARRGKWGDTPAPPGDERCTGDLYGTMQHEGATLGIMITTSGYGPGSAEFANGKPLYLIDGPGLISICQESGIPARNPRPRDPQGPKVKSVSWLCRPVASCC